MPETKTYLSVPVAFRSRLACSFAQILNFLVHGCVDVHSKRSCRFQWHCTEWDELNNRTGPTSGQLRFETVRCKGRSTDAHTVHKAALEHIRLKGFISFFAGCV